MTAPIVYLERFGRPARRRLGRLVAEAKAANPLAPVTVVTPNQYAGISLRRTLANGGGDDGGGNGGAPHGGGNDGSTHNGGGAGRGLLNVRFMAAARLAEFLGGPTLAAAGKRPLTPLVELAMIRAVADEMKGELPVLGRVTHHSSLHRSLAAAFGDLARLDGGGLDRLADSGALAGETVKLYRRFRERTPGYYQSEELARAAAAAVRSGAAATAQRDIGAVIFHLPSDPSPGQRELLSALAESGGGGCRLIVGLTGETDTDEAARKLDASLGDANGVAPASSASPEPSASPASIAAADAIPPEPGAAADRPEVERRPSAAGNSDAESAADAAAAGGVGAPGGNAANPDNADGPDDAAAGLAVDGIVSAPDVREEVRRAVRDMLQLARREGVPFHRMAALYRYAEPYAAQLRLELRLAGLPIAGPEPATLQDTAAGRLLLGLLEALLEDFRRPQLMQWLAEAPLRASLLQSNPFSPPESAMGMEADGRQDAASFDYERRRSNAPPSAELAHWEALSRKAGVIGGLEQWTGRVGNYRDDLRERIKADSYKEEFSPARSRAMEEEAASAGRLIAFVQQLGQRHPAQELASRRPGRETAERRAAAETAERRAAPESAQQRAADDRHSWADFSAWALRLFRDYALPEELWPEEGGHASAFKRVEEKLKELASLDAVQPDAGPTFRQFRQAVDDALNVPAGRSGVTGSGVFAANLSAALGMEFDAVWVLGMAEGAFPGRAAEDPLLPDAVRLQAGDGRLPLRRGAAAEERRLYLAALAAGRRRFLSYARTGQTGRRAQHPAPWLLDAATELNGGGRVSAEDLARPASDDAAEWLTLIQSPQSGLDDAADGRAADAHEFDLAAVAEWRKSGYPLREHPLALSEPAPVGANAGGDSGNGAGDSPAILGRALRLEDSRSQADLTEWDGLVEPIAAASPRLSRALTRTVSPTRLERWAVCPYRFFLGDVLSLSALEPPDELLTISAMERGSLVHKILEEFIRESIETGGGEKAAAPWTPEQRGRLLDIAETEFQAAAERGVTGHRILWEAAKDEMRRDLETFLDKDDEWRLGQGVRPYQVEWRFGEADTPVPLTLSDGSVVNFRGVIDRVDLSYGGGRVAVLDYKSGGIAAYGNMDDDPLAQGARLQLPVYALAARSVLPLPDAGGGQSGSGGAPDGGASGEGGGGQAPEIQAAYWFVSARGEFRRKEFALNSETQGRFSEVVGQIVGGIRQGVFPANPGPAGRDGSQNCRFCDFQRVCPADKRRLWERKQNSPQAAPYIALAQPDADADDDE